MKPHGYGNDVPMLTTRLPWSGHETSALGTGSRTSTTPPCADAQLGEEERQLIAKYASRPDTPFHCALLHALAAILGRHPSAVRAAWIDMLGKEWSPAYVGSLAAYDMLHILPQMVESARSNGSSDGMETLLAGIDADIATVWRMEMAFVDGRYAELWDGALRKERLDASAREWPYSVYGETTKRCLRGIEVCLMWWCVSRWTSGCHVGQAAEIAAVEILYS